MKKKLFSLTLTLLGCLCLAVLFPEPADAIVSGACGENVTWTLDPGGTLIIQGSGPMEDYYTEDDDGTFWLYSPPFWTYDEEQSQEENRAPITRIVVEDGVESIGGGAFRDLENLTSVEIPDSVETIGGYAFHNNPKLTEVNIPASVTDIGDRAFYECLSLVNIRVSEENPAFKDLDGVLFTKDGTKMRAYGAGRTAASYAVPDGVQTLYPSTFSYNAALESVTLPVSLMEIQNWAFGHTGLKSVVLPPYLETLEYCAFGSCENLTDATLPRTLATIGEWAFGDCPLKNVYYEGSNAQWDAIEILEDNDDLLNAVLYYDQNPYCPHPALTHHDPVPHTCTEDGTVEYWTCDTCGSIFSDADAKNHLADVTDPAAHNYRSAVTVEPTCSETGIRTYTCTVCGPETQGHSYEVDIPATEEHHYTDGYCDNLLRDGVTVCGAAEQIAGGSFGDNDGNLTWKLNDRGTLTISGEGGMNMFTIITVANLYSRVTHPWAEYVSDIRTVVIEEGVTDVSNFAFYNCRNLKTLYLPSTIKRVGLYGDGGVFHNCSLRDVYMPFERRTWVTKFYMTSDVLAAFNQATLHFSDDITETRISIKEATKDAVSLSIPCVERAAAWFVLYDRDGHYLSVQSAELPADRLSEPVFPVNSPGAASFAVMVTERDSLIPLCGMVRGEL